MLLCVAALPVAIVFQKHLLPDRKDEWGGGVERKRGSGAAVLYGAQSMSIVPPAFSLSRLPVFSVSMISMKKP